MKKQKEIYLLKMLIYGCSTIAFLFGGLYLKQYSNILVGVFLSGGCWIISIFENSEEAYDVWFEKKKNRFLKRKEKTNVVSEKRFLYKIKSFFNSTKLWDDFIIWLNK